MTSRPNRPRSIAYYQGEEDSVAPFARWLEELDVSLQARVLTRLDRVEAGNLGDWKGLKDGIFELRLTVGPGLRIYFGIDGDSVVLLLGGGDKKSQNKDIQTAKIRWQSYLKSEPGGKQGANN